MHGLPDYSIKEAIEYFILETNAHKYGKAAALVVTCLQCIATSWQEALLACPTQVAIKGRRQKTGTLPNLQETPGHGRIQQAL